MFVTIRSIAVSPTTADILPATSLIEYCGSCPDHCCSGRTGRTLLTLDERTAVQDAGYPDYTTPWDGQWSYLEATRCKHLALGRCQINSIKPLVCRVFPFVPRVIMGHWWLILVSACPASPFLGWEFAQSARLDARNTLKGWDVSTYAAYWRDIKSRDFDSDELLMMIPVFPEEIAGSYLKERRMSQHNELEVPGCLGTKVQEIASETDFQVLRVSIEDGGEIPLHSHNCAATMIILSGQARTLGKDGRVVRSGDVVVKTPREPHGFADPAGCFSFLSISSNNGILTEKGWDMGFL